MRPGLHAVLLELMLAPAIAEDRPERADRGLASQLGAVQLFVATLPA